MRNDNWGIYHYEIPGIIQEGMRTAEMQRLQDVGMNCGMNYTSFPFYGTMEPYSRFEHSVGCALIIWHFTGSAVQALAGLFHDIATPPFAHVVDFMRHDHVAQESTESGTAEILSGSTEIKTLLERNGIALEEVVDYHIYPIADNDSPRLSADRLEYTLGCLRHYHLCSEETVRRYYNNLTVLTNEEGIPELGFTDKDTAEAFALDSLKCSRIFTEDEDRCGMEYLAVLLKKAVGAGILDDADLRSTESSVIAKLQQSAMADDWEHYTRLQRIQRADTPVNDAWVQVNAKRRFIDPLCRDHGRVRMWSKRFHDELEEFLQRDFSKYLYADEGEKE